MINMWFKVEDKFQNTSKVIVFTRNHTDDDTDDDRTKNNAKFDFYSRHTKSFSGKLSRIGFKDISPEKNMIF